MIPSMGSIMAVGHAAIADLFTGAVEISEKVDGSQFSFRLTEEGEIEMRSKGQEILEGNPSSKMFQPAIDSVRERRARLVPGFIYRGEFLSKPKHNSLCYSRIPKGNIVIFDVETEPGAHLNAAMRQYEAHHIDLEAVPVFYVGEVTDHATWLHNLLERDSFLGNVKIEGVVVKNFAQWLHGHYMAGKYVSPAFKEVHSREWKASNPSKGDFIESVIETYRTEARWMKGVQHLKERGEWTGGPQDIGPLMKEVAEDVMAEEADQMAVVIFNHFKSQISRGVVRGIPQWVKEQLLRGGAV